MRRFIQLILFDETSNLILLEKDSIQLNELDSYFSVMTVPASILARILNTEVLCGMEIRNSTHSGN